MEQIYHGFTITDEYDGHSKYITILKDGYHCLTDCCHAADKWGIAHAKLSIDEAIETQNASWLNRKLYFQQLCPPCGYLDCDGTVEEHDPQKCDCVCHDGGGA